MSKCYLYSFIDLTSCNPCFTRISMERRYQKCRINPSSMECIHAWGQILVRVQIQMYCNTCTFYITFHSLLKLFITVYWVQCRTVNKIQSYNIWKVHEFWSCWYDLERNLIAIDVIFGNMHAHFKHLNVLAPANAIPENQTG